MRLYLNIAVPVSGAAGIRAALEALVGLDRVYLRAHPDTPSIYDSGVRYLRDVEHRSQRRPDAELWVTIPDALRQGGGDCKVLASWRVAELRELGVVARPALLRRGRTWHVVVRTGAGIEDPSKRLGMSQ